MTDLRGLALVDLHASDLIRLIDESVLEGFALEFKEQIPGNSDIDKRDYLYEVDAFANASGGDIIFGIRENQGRAVELVGLTGINVDEEVRRLYSLCLTSIDPRIPGFQVRPVLLDEKKESFAIIARVPRSWSRPHMVTFRGADRFYVRHGNAKMPLDIDELRSLFALTESAEERIRNFRRDRLAKITVGETPIPLPGASPRVVLHLVPMGALFAGTVYDLQPLALGAGELLKPIYGGGFSKRYNFDGLLSYSEVAPGGLPSTYVQVFRNGTIEAVDAEMLRAESEDIQSRFIPSNILEAELIDGLKRLFTIHEKLGVSAPVIVMLSLLNVRGYWLAIPERFSGRVLQQRNEVDRENLVGPETIVEDLSAEASKVMRPLLDAIWQAGGYPRSLNYDETGTWIRRA